MAIADSEAPIFLYFCILVVSSPLSIPFIFISTRTIAHPLSIVLGCCLSCFGPSPGKEDKRDHQGRTCSGEEGPGIEERQGCQGS